MSPRERRRLLRLLGVAAALAVLLSAAFLIGWPPAWEVGGSDFLFHRPTSPSSRVAIVAVDIDSHRELVGDRPVNTRPREIFAQLLDRLRAIRRSREDVEPASETVQAQEGHGVHGHHHAHRPVRDGRVNEARRGEHRDGHEGGGVHAFGPRRPAEEQPPQEDGQPAA